jgi:hypothetical protein
MVPRFYKTEPSQVEEHLHLKVYSAAVVSSQLIFQFGSMTIGRKEKLQWNKIGNSSIHSVGAYLI